MHTISRKMQVGLDAIEAQVDTLDDSTKSHLDDTSKFSFEEVISFQQHKSLAVAIGIVNAEDGQTYYNWLGGESVDMDRINALPLHIRIYMTIAMAAIIDANTQSSTGIDRFAMR